MRPGHPQRRPRISPLGQAVAIAVISHGPVAGTLAQTPSAGPLEDIIVTAQKRSQSLQEVPLTVAVVSEQALRDTGATGFDDLIPRLAGVSGFTTGVTSAIWAIRGLSSATAGNGGEPSVGFYQDEAYAGYVEYSGIPLFDTRRVEVAKGPQGTLYGKNATAGAILVYNNRPDPSTNLFSAHVGAGNVAQRRADAVGNWVVNPGLAIRAAGFYESLGDYQRNKALPGSTGGGFERWSARLGGVWQLDERFDVYAFLQRFAASSNQWMTNLQARTADHNPAHVYSALNRSRNQIDSDIAHLRIDWRPRDGLSLHSITDYRDSALLWEADAIGLSQPQLRALTLAVFRRPIDAIIANQGPYRNRGSDFGSRLLQQELRLALEREDWFATVGTNWLRYDELRPQQGAVIHFAPLSQLPFRKVDSTGYENQRESLGFYVDGTWQFAPRWQLTTGVRYSRDRTQSRNFAAVDLYRLAPGIPVGNSWFADTSRLMVTAGCSAGSITSPAAPCLAGLSDTRTDIGWTPRIALSHSPTPTTTVYAGYSRGYKAGGFDIVTDGRRLLAYDPEHVDAFELGLRHSSAMLRYGLSLYSNDYNDLQVSAIVNAIPRTTNAATAHARGLEGEFTWRLTEHLELNGNYAYTDARYDSGVLNLFAQPIAARGLRLQRTPEHTLNLGCALTLPMTSGATLRFVPNLHYQSAMELSPLQRADLRQPAYVMLDARLQYTAPEGRWQIALAGENLTGESIIMRAADLLGFGAALGYRPTEPLLRLELATRFGAATR